MSEVEIARGYLIGTEGTVPPPIDRSQSARRALEQVVLHFLQRGTTGVAFSGGRDSSLVLAVAVHVARREGLPDPVPLTRVFPGIEEADEHEWQELMIRHLELDDWQRIEFDDELDVIGPIAQRHLLAHGLVWPAAIGASVPLLEALPGGALLDGEGGDEFLGYEIHRVGPVTHLLRSPRPIRRARVNAAVGSIAPKRVRSYLERRDAPGREFVWLRDEVRREFLTALAAEAVNRPLPFASSVRELLLRRAQVMGSRNRSILAASYGVEMASPLAHPEFVHAVAREGRFLGRGDRTTVLHHLAGDLLPGAIIERRSKAAFNRAYLGRHSRSFAESWVGGGINSRLVDPERLRDAWLEQPAHWMTAVLIQQAWLSTSQSSSTTKSSLHHD
jgi:asparagine synthase (glutamine-hydrolysing)